jgi:hypothetical protein
MKNSKYNEHKEEQMTRNSRIYRWSYWVGGATLLVASTAMVSDAGAFEAVETTAATGAATVVDLQTAPNLPNVPQQQINTLHNNISWANHLIAKQ